jgi:hypothetical protein
MDDEIHSAHGRIKAVRQLSSLTAFIPKVFTTFRNILESNLSLNGTSFKNEPFEALEKDRNFHD